MGLFFKIYFSFLYVLTTGVKIISISLILGGIIKPQSSKLFYSKSVSDGNYCAIYIKTSLIPNYYKIRLIS